MHQAAPPQPATLLSPPLACRNAAFPADALCICAVYYALLKPGGFAYAIAYACLAFCSYVNVVLMLQTAAALLRARVFVPDAKWGPLSFMRLAHEAFRGALPPLMDLADEAGSAAANGDTVAAFKVRAATLRAGVPFLSTPASHPRACALSIHACTCAHLYACMVAHVYARGAC